MTDVDDVINSLRNTNLTPKGVSFQGQALKLDTIKDAQVVVDAINNCEDLEYLNLEGNTLGVEAAEVIARALEKQSKFKRALWKDMFTGRMKTEIPKALEYLGDGLVKAGTHLTELDLSDNAFGPTGVAGLASFLRSSSCYALEELRLNNNGLGIIGGKLLAQALLDCYNSSKMQGKPLALRVFVAGRNRLENDGAKALALVFKTLGSLQEIVMPQNGIYHVGISALSKSFTHNKDLEILNLNDNTLGPKGAAAIAEILPTLRSIKEINFGDCLLKTRGAISLASGLKDTNELEDLTLGFNEIRTEGGLAIVSTLSNKKNLRCLVLDGNHFDKTGRNQIETKLKEMGKINVLTSLEDCESEAEEDDDDENNSGSDPDESQDNIHDNTVFDVGNLTITDCSFGDFVKNPSGENFLGLGNDRDKLILDEVKKHNDTFLDFIIPTLMKISALTTSSQKDVSRYALNCSEQLYSHLFTWTQVNDTLSLTNNSLLVHLGLIKSEDKKFNPTWDVKGCLRALEYISGKNYLPESTKDSLRLFMKKDLDKNLDLIEYKKSLSSLLE